MATSKNKKSFKLNVLGLLKWESEEWTVKEVALILILVMVFIITIIIVLKVYAIPTLSTPILIDKIGNGLQKIIKSRAP
jgi:hypothetical protein